MCTISAGLSSLIPSKCLLAKAIFKRASQVADGLLNSYFIFAILYYSLPACAGDFRFDTKKAAN
jgi:hypothetical protein